MFILCAKNRAKRDLGLLRRFYSFFVQSGKSMYNIKCKSCGNFALIAAKAWQIINNFYKSCEYGISFFIFIFKFIFYDAESCLMMLRYINHEVYDFEIPINYIIISSRRFYDLLNTHVSLFAKSSFLGRIFKI